VGLTVWELSKRRRRRGKKERRRKAMRGGKALGHTKSNIFPSFNPSFLSFVTVTHTNTRGQSVSPSFPADALQGR